MGGFRAKDADRDRYVDIIEAAYVDGQLGEQDRELRVSRALTAETLDELDSLTRDLQRPPGAPAPSRIAVNARLKSATGPAQAFGCGEGMSRRKPRFRKHRRPVRPGSGVADGPRFRAGIRSSAATR